jgi:SPP1 gp7 family putative phage head morphogenesis protein
MTQTRPPLIDPDRLPNRAMTDAETLLKRRTFAVERQAVLRLQAQYREAWRDIRDSMDVLPPTSSLWRNHVVATAEQRIGRLKDEVLATVERATKAALVGNYFGRVYALDVATGEDVRVNVPFLSRDILREDYYDDLIRDLLGDQWRSQYDVELDDLIVQIRRAIGTGMSNGEGMSAIQRRVRDAMGVETDRRKGFRANFNRVQVITRTTVQTVANQGALAAYKANSDILKGWSWLCARDERTCPACFGMDGKNFAFKSQQRPPPLHPNCRCTSVAWIKPDALEADTKAPARKSLRDWSRGYGMERELADFLGTK